MVGMQNDAAFLAMSLTFFFSIKKSYIHIYITPACNVGDQGLIPGLGRSPGESKGYPLQYSGLENSVDCIVH